MQAPNAQGIMGLMAQGRAPQQPQAPQAPQAPVPSPMKASPMAGLGSVEDRVAAYRGNPAPLQQRYAMSQDLLDLLALQKIKSEKDAAMRQMQMQMSQQQAAQGAEPMTVAQQREKEVMEMTKNELAQQRGETAQQQTQQQQENMQKLMAGIAGAPGAQAAAQPRMMATGGIVAFATGDKVPNVDDKKPLDEAAQREIDQARGDRAAMLMTLRKLAAAGYDVASLIPRGIMGAAESAITRPLRALGVPIPYLPEAAYGGDRSSMTPAMDKIRREEAQATAAAAPQMRTAVAADEFQRGPEAGPAVRPLTAAAPPPPPAPPPTPAAPPAATPAAPAAPAAAGLASLTGPGTPADPLAQELRSATITGMGRDPQQARLEEEQRQRQLLEFKDEQARRGKYADMLQRMYEQEFDPERQRQEGLKRFLIGAGGRRYGEFGAGAGAGIAYDAAQRQQQMERLKGIEDVRQGIFGIQKGAVEKGIAGGEKAYTATSDRARQAMASGSDLYKTESTALQSGLDRESRERVAKENNRIQAEIAQATRDQTLEVRRQGFVQDIARMESQALRDLQRGPDAKALADLRQLKAMNPKGFTKEQEAELINIQKRLDEAEDLIRASMDVHRASLGGLGGRGRGTGAGLSDADRALIDKYTR